MLRRSALNPIITREAIPDISRHVRDVTSVFNPGAIRWGDKILLMLRVQTRGRETVLIMAESDDGERFNVSPRLVQFDGVESLGERIHHIYDPRLTAIDGVLYAVVAMDTDNGCKLGIGRSTDLEHFELISFCREPESRNGVLFPEKIGGRYMRLERPNRVEVEGGVTSGAEIVLAESDDLIDWQIVRPVMGGRWHYWDELIGSGPPPIKTAAGWLHVYHGVAMHFGSPIYQAGVVLLDIGDPSRVLARSHNNILEPRELYEMVGQVPNVVFPGGMIVDDYDDAGNALPKSLVRIYYGAADTVVGMATCSVQDLLDACE